MASYVKDAIYVKQLYPLIHAYVQCECSSVCQYSICSNKTNGTRTIYKNLIQRIYVIVRIFVVLFVDADSLLLYASLKRKQQKQLVKALHFAFC